MKNKGGAGAHLGLIPPSSLNLPPCKFSIISGGQTGVDRAALDIALALKIPCGGWCPRGRRAEDGRIPDRYPLKESSSRSYASRTIQNVIDSDGTLILTFGTPTGGTLLTKNAAQRRHKPFLVIDLGQSSDVELVQDWLSTNEIDVLNVAGPRASQFPSAYETSKRFLRRILSSRTRNRRNR